MERQDQSPCRVLYFPSADLESCDVLTNTGRIYADVPLDSLRFKFLWQSSRPRFLSDVEVPSVKEGRAGVFSISGRLGEHVKKGKHKIELPQIETPDQNN